MFLFLCRLLWILHISCVTAVVCCVFLKNFAWEICAAVHNWFTRACSMFNRCVRPSPLLVGWPTNWVTEKSLLSKVSRITGQGLFQNVKTVPLIFKFSHVNSVHCEVRVPSLILDINQFIHNNNITCRKQSTVPLRHILTVHTHRRRSVEWVGKASLKIYLSSTSFFQIIPFFRFLDPIMSSLTHRGKKHKIGLSLIMS